MVREEKPASGAFRSISAPTMDLLLDPVVSSRLWRSWAYWWLEERVKSQFLRTSDRAVLQSTALLSLQRPAFGGVSQPRSLQAWKRGGLWAQRKEHAQNLFQRGKLDSTPGSFGTSRWVLLNCNILGLRAIRWQDIKKDTSLPNADVTSPPQYT